MIVTCPHRAPRGAPRGGEPRAGAPRGRDTCPGCAWLGVEYTEQLEAKRATVARALERYRELAGVTVEPTHAAAPIEGYRTRAKWIAGPGGGFGLYADGAEHVVVDVPQCRIAAPILLEVADMLRRELANAGPIRGLHAIDVREAIGQGRPKAMLTLIVDHGGDLDAARERGASLASRVPAIAAVFMNERAPDSPQILGRRTLPIAGARALTDRMGSVTTVATPGSFVQAHRGQAAALERSLVERSNALAATLGRPPRVLELFAGAGAFSLALAKAGAEVVAIESHAPAVDAMRDAAAAMRVSIRAEVEDAGKFVEETRTAFDLVVVDPPRRGLPPHLRAAIARLRPACLAYVSCDPRTFARDLAHFARLGLGARSVLPIDMIPLTDHVETLAFLEPMDAPSRVVLAATDSFVIVDEPPHARPQSPAPGARPLLVFDDGVSGALPWAIDPSPAPPVAARVRAIVSGVTHKRGNIRAGKATLRYERVGVHSGHSEIVVTLDGARPKIVELALDRLASFGHPPLGDARRCNAASLRHAFEAHGIDRPMVHVEWAKVASLEVAAPLAGDFAAALASLNAPSGPKP